ncbi:MAG: 4-hydroxythreonine-4-phosphate dehydrogenase PdxA [Verrucomicrobiota bacterium]
MTTAKNPRIGITLGDCAGIGPEIIDLALKSGRLPDLAEYVVIGRSPECQPGGPTIETARAAAAALEEAVTLACRGELQAVVTGPIHKAQMYEAGFKFPGQTEFFADRCGVKNFAMCLTGGKITVALVTAHIPLEQVSGALKQSEIVRVGLLLADFLRSRSLNRNGQDLTGLTGQASTADYGVSGGPRIAVAGLNPHAGESGKIGREEIEVIGPAVEELNAQRSTLNPQLVAFTGPHSPDTLFHRLVEGEFDAALCMYHDQGLIPLKLHAFHNGVNVTLGLPFPRTSPDHGTAFEIAGKGIARPDSMIAAINLAVELAQTESLK